jgi:cytochrome P450
MWIYILLALFLPYFLQKLKTLLAIHLFKGNFWKDRNIAEISTSISFLDLVSARKFNGECDLKYYKSLVESGQKYGGIVEFGTPILFLNDLQLVKDIFIKDFQFFIDRRDMANSDPIFTQGLFFLRGQVWKDMRSFLSPTFTSGKIKRMFEHFGR